MEEIAAPFFYLLITL